MVMEIFGHFRINATMNVYTHGGQETRRAVMNHIGPTAQKAPVASAQRR
ncbi:integrase [Streptomyces sp. NPDC048291]